MLGSTEWAEKHAAELNDKTVVYINSDSTGKGWLNVGGSHGLQPFMNEVARDVIDPLTGKPVFEEARRRQVLNTPDAERGPREQDQSLWLAPLGSGSDYTPFLQHLTLASINLAFGGDSNGGIYHSMCKNTVHWFTETSDGDFSYGRTLSQLTGTMLLRLSRRRGAPVPVQGHVRHADAIRGSSTGWRRRARTQNFDLAPVRKAVEALGRAAQDYERAYARMDGSSSAAIDARAELRPLNKLLLQSEQKLGNGDGLPRRDWFKHQIYAPGFYTGLGRVGTMPQIREGSRNSARTRRGTVSARSRRR